MATWKEILTLPPTSEVDFNAQSITGVDALHLQGVNIADGGWLRILEESVAAGRYIELVAEDVTGASQQVKLPNATGTLALKDTTETFTNVVCNEGGAFSIREDSSGSTYTSSLYTVDLTASQYIGLPNDTGIVALTGTMDVQELFNIESLGMKSKSIESNSLLNNDGGILITYLAVGPNTESRGGIYFYGETYTAGMSTLVTPIQPTQPNQIELPDDSGTIALTGTSTEQTFTGNVSVATPTLSSHATTKTYVDEFRELYDDISPSLSGDLNVLTNKITSSFSFEIDAGTVTSSSARTLTIDAKNPGSGDGSIVLNAKTGITGTAIKDESDMASNSGKHLVTQRAIKKYVDGQNRYEYEYKVCNYSSSTANTSYLPLAGYIIDQTSIMSGNKEHIAMIAPHDGEFYKIFWRPTVAQTSGNFSILMYRGEDGDTHADSNVFRSSFAVGGSFPTVPPAIANTTYKHEIGVTQTANPTDNTFSAGDVISIGIDPTIAPGDVNCTVVFKYDMTT